MDLLHFVCVALLAHYFVILHPLLAKLAGNVTFRRNLLSAAHRVRQLRLLNDVRGLVLALQHQLAIVRQVGVVLAHLEALDVVRDWLTLRLHSDSAERRAPRRLLDGRDGVWLRRQVTLVGGRVVPRVQRALEVHLLQVVEVLLVRQLDGLALAPGAHQDERMMWN